MPRFLAVKLLIGVLSSRCGQDPIEYQEAPTSVVALYKPILTADAGFVKFINMEVVKQSLADYFVSSKILAEPRAHELAPEIRETMALWLYSLFVKTDEREQILAGTIVENSVREKIKPSLDTKFEDGIAFCDFGLVTFSSTAFEIAFSHTQAKTVQFNNVKGITIEDIKQLDLSKATRIDINRMGLTCIPCLSKCLGISVLDVTYNEIEVLEVSDFIAGGNYLQMPRLQFLCANDNPTKTWSSDMGKVFTFHNAIGVVSVPETDDDPTYYPGKTMLILLGKAGNPGPSMN